MGNIIDKGWGDTEMRQTIISINLIQLYSRMHRILVRLYSTVLFHSLGIVVVVERGRNYDGGDPDERINERKERGIRRENCLMMWCFNSQSVRNMRMMSQYFLGKESMAKMW